MRGAVIGLLAVAQINT